MIKVMLLFATLKKALSDYVTGLVRLCSARRVGVNGNFTIDSDIK